MLRFRTAAPDATAKFFVRRFFIADALGDLTFRFDLQRSSLLAASTDLILRGIMGSGLYRQVSWTHAVCICWYLLV